VPKTFAWFEGRKRPPSEYEELTVGLHFGEEALVHTRVGTWTLDNTLLRSVPWEDFRDPAQLHYRTWVALQDRAERELGATLDLARSAGFVDGLDPAWREEMAVLGGGLAFAEWGVAMAMQYVERFCLSSAVGQAAQLQRADPGLYNLLTNGILQARLDYDRSKTSCRAIANQAGGENGLAIATSWVEEFAAMPSQANSAPLDFAN